MKKTITVIVAVLVVGTIVGCGGSSDGSDTTTTPPPISSAELDALNAAHAHLHAEVTREFQAIQSCGSINCFVNEFFAPLTAELEALNTTLQHAEESATGDCRVAIQTAQSSLVAVQSRLKQAEQAVQSFNFEGITGIRPTIATFTNDLDDTKTECGSSAGGASS